MPSALKGHVVDRKVVTAKSSSANQIAVSADTSSSAGRRSGDPPGASRPEALAFTDPA